MLLNLLVRIIMQYLLHHPLERASFILFTTARIGQEGGGSTWPKGRAHLAQGRGNLAPAQCPGNLALGQLLAPSR